MSSYTGVSELVSPLGANALATGSTVAFASSSPPPALVAHELAHVVQRDRAGRASGGALVASRTSSAEREADAIGEHVARHGARAPMPAVTAAPEAQVHLDGYASLLSPSPAQDALLQQWIQMESGAPSPPPRFDPSPSSVPQPQDFPSMAFAGGMALPQLGDGDRAVLTRFLQSDASAGAPASAAPPPAPSFPPSMGSSHVPMGTFGTGSSGLGTLRPLSTGSDSIDPFMQRMPQSGSDMFGRPPAHPCPNCHGNYYERVPPRPPPYDPHPDWVRTRDATAASTLAREGHDTRETGEQIELQVLTAEGQAIGAAAQQGSVPEDLREKWQQATMTAEALRMSAPGLAATARPATTTSPTTLDDTLTERARGAIDAFYWSLVDALQVQEARERVEEARSRTLHDSMPAPRPPPCPNCHSEPEPRFEFPILLAPPPRSPVVMAREQALGEALTFEQWRDALAAFDATVKGPLEGLLGAVLPDDSAELKQLTLARNLRNRFEALTGAHPDIRRIPAVFYPQDDVRLETQPDGTTDHVAQGYSWYLFVYKDGDRFVLKDITSDRDFTNTQDYDLTSGLEHNIRQIWGEPQDLVDYPDDAMADLFDQLNTAIRFPYGKLYYELPGGRQRELETTEPWSMSDWLSAIGIGLAALGLVLATAGAGTPAAVAMIGSGVAGALATEAQYEELEQQGIATSDDRNRAYLMIAVDLFGALSVGLGQIVEAPEAFGRLSSLAGRLYAPVRMISTGLNIAQAYVMTEQFVSQLEALEALPSSPERASAMRRLVLIGLATGALQIFAMRSDLHELSELSSTARPRLTMASDGTLELAEGEAAGVSTASAAAGDAGAGGFRWRAQVDDPVRDPDLGARSVVVDVERGPDGLIRRVGVRHGPNASAADIALHERVASVLSRWGGLQGRIRQAWRDILAMFGVRRPPIELEMEVWKLEELARRRIAILEDAGAHPDAHVLAVNDLDLIEQQLASAQSRARAAAAAPAASGAAESQIWMRDSPQGYPRTPEGMAWYLGSEGRWQLRSLAGVEHGGVQIRAEYTDSGELIEVSNRAQVERSRVLENRRLPEVEDRLEAMGYTVDSQGRISRRVADKNYMVALRADPITGIVTESVAETEAQVQQRLESGLSRGQRATLGTLRTQAAAATNEEVVLVEGVFDLRTTWRETIDANGGRDACIAQLESRGLMSDEAEHIIDTLIARPGDMQLVRGTAPLRGFDYVGNYGGTVPAGGHVHHVDPLYLGGTHEVLIGLSEDAHRAVHEFFDGLELPHNSALPGEPLQPGRLYAAVPASAWRRGAATLSHRGSLQPGRIVITPL